jgi:hypothetical protein
MELKSKKFSSKKFKLAELKQAWKEREGISWQNVNYSCFFLMDPFRAGECGDYCSILKSCWKLIMRYFTLVPLNKCSRWGWVCLRTSFCKILKSSNHRTSPKMVESVQLTTWTFFGHRFIFEQCARCRRFYISPASWVMWGSAARRTGLGFLHAVQVQRGASGFEQFARLSSVLCSKSSRAAAPLSHDATNDAHISGSILKRKSPRVSIVTDS